MSRREFITLLSGAAAWPLAARAHKYPFVQHPPVAHIDRPWWKLDRHAYPSEQEFNKAWDKAWKIERRVEKLALKFGGKFVGT